MLIGPNLNNKINLLSVLRAVSKINIYPYVAHNFALTIFHQYNEFRFLDLIEFCQQYKRTATRMKPGHLPAFRQTAGLLLGLLATRSAVACRGYRLTIACLFVGPFDRAFGLTEFVGCFKWDLFTGRVIKRTNRRELLSGIWRPFRG